MRPKEKRQSIGFRIYCREKERETVEVEAGHGYVERGGREWEEKGSKGTRDKKVRE